MPSRAAQRRRSSLPSRFISTLKRVAIQPFQDVAIGTAPGSALNQLRARALIAILGERGGSGVEKRGDFGGRRQ